MRPAQWAAARRAYEAGETAAAVAETEGSEADKLGKLLTAAEKLDKLCGEPTATAIQVELGAAEEYAE